MKLGYVQMPDPTRNVGEHLDLAESLGLDQAYLPEQTADKLSHLCGLPFKRLKIVMDAAAFGPLSPSDLEHAVRNLDHLLDGKFCIGVDVSGDGLSTMTRTDAQTFETLFSHPPAERAGYTQCRYPMKPPCPKVVGLMVTGSSVEASLAAARGYLPMTPSWLAPKEVARHWPAIVAGATSALRRADPSHWQLARTVVVHDDPSVIENYVFGSQSPIRRYYMQRNLRSDVDELLKSVLIAGTAAQVATQISSLREAVGEFGMLNMVDHSGSDKDLTRRTLVSLAEEILPMVNETSANPIKELERL